LRDCSVGAGGVGAASEPFGRTISAREQGAKIGRLAFGIRPQHAGEIAAKALRSSSMQGNPVALSHGDLEAVLRRAL
jgi:alcohol dehydrogenase class IV